MPVHTLVASSLTAATGKVSRSRSQIKSGRNQTGAGLRQVSTSRLTHLATNLPVMIDLLDREEAIARILAYLDDLIQRGMITRTLLRMVQGREV